MNGHQLQNISTQGLLYNTHHAGMKTEGPQFNRVHETTSMKDYQETARLNLTVSHAETPINIRQLKTSSQNLRVEK